MVSSFESGHVSEYRLWLYFDAVAARGIEREITADLAGARCDAQFLVETTVSDLASSMAAIPAACQTLVIRTACRIPLIGE
jgi:hypothetical protein